MYSSCGCVHSCVWEWVWCHLSHLLPSSYHQLLHPGRRRRMRFLWITCKPSTGSWVGSGHWTASSPGYSSLPLSHPDPTSQCRESKHHLFIHALWCLYTVHLTQRPSCVCVWRTAVLYGSLITCCTCCTCLLIRMCREHSVSKLNSECT